MSAGPSLARPPAPGDAGRPPGAAGRPRRRGWGVALVLFPLGWLGWLWLLYAGLRARCWRWAALGVAELAVVVGELFGLAAIPTTNAPAEVVTSSAIVGVWLAVVVHGFAVRRSYVEGAPGPSVRTQPLAATGATRP